MLIDSHTHVQFAAYDGDREAVITRAHERGIWMVNVGTQYATSKAAIELAEKYPERLHATVGFHPLNIEKTYNDPQEAPEVGQETFNIDGLRTLVSHPKVVAVGECGLDWYRVSDEKARKKQGEVFLAQLTLSKEVGKPIIIHCRDAHDRMAELLRQHGAPECGGVVHFFTGTAEQAKAYQELGLLVSFGGVITFAKEYEPIVAAVPLEQILLETDAPYVAPVPYRGKRNEPAYVEEVAKKVAEVKSISLEEVARVTTENTKTVFKI